MDLKNLLAFQIDRSLNATDNQLELFNALASLASSFEAMRSEQNIFLPKLTKLFQETPFPFIQYRISCLLRMFAEAKQDSLVTNRDQLVSTFNQMLNSQDTYKRRLTLEVIEALSPLFKESLSTYHILLSKVMVGEEEEMYLKVLGRVVGDSKYLSQIFAKNYREVARTNLYCALDVLKMSGVSHLQRTQMLVWTLGEWIQSERKEKGVKWRILREVWREIPFSPHLCSYILSHIDHLSFPPRQLKQVTERIETFHPYLVPETNDNSLSLLDHLYTCKKNGFPLPTYQQHIFFPHHSSISMFPLPSLLLLFYSPHCEDSRLSTLSISTFLPNYLKIFLTLRYPQTSTNIIKYMMDCELTTKQYKRLVFYHAIALSYQKQQSMEVLVGLSRFRGEQSLEHLYTRYILACHYATQQILSNNVVGAQVLMPMQKAIRELEGRFNKVNFGLARASLVVIEQMASQRIRKHQDSQDTNNPLNPENPQDPIHNYETLLRPFVPQHLLTSTLDGVLSCLLYYPKHIYLNHK